MNTMFISLIFLIGGSVIFVLYYFLFPAESSKKKDKEDKEQALNEQIRKLQQENDSMDVKLIEAKGHAGKKEEEIKNITALSHDLKQQIQSLIEQKSSFERRIVELSEQSGKIESQRVELSNKINSLQDIVSKLEEKLKFKDQEFQKAADKLKEEKENILKKEDIMQKKIQDSDSKLNQIIGDLKIKEEKIKSYEVKIAELSAQKQDSQKIDDLEKRIQGYEIKVNEISGKNHELAEQLIKKEEENRRIKQDVDNELSRQKEESFKKVEELNNQILLLHDQLDTVRTRDEGREMTPKIPRKYPENTPKISGQVGAGRDRSGQADEGPFENTKGKIETTQIVSSEPAAEQADEIVTEAKQVNEGELSERQKQMLDYLKEHKKITRRDCVDKFGVSVPTAARDLKELQDRGLIKPYGPPGPGRYFILS